MVSPRDTRSRIAVLSAHCCHADGVDEQALDKLALEAYVYFYPLVLVSETALRFPLRNKFFHMKKTPSPEDKTVIRPNVDTIYSIAILDLSRSAITISLPQSDDRYFSLQLMDHWSDTFSIVGTGSGHTTGCKILVRGPKQLSGMAPQDNDGTCEEVVNAPTSLVWAALRIEVKTPWDVQ